MKKYLLLLLLVPLMGFNLPQASRLCIKWHAKMPLFESPETTTYELHQMNTDLNQSFQWGYFVTFSPDGSFETHYSAPCGLDCFTRVFGTYKWIDEQHIAVSVRQITRNEICAKSSENTPFELGVFKVKFDIDKLVLQK